MAARTGRTDEDFGPDAAAGIVGPAWVTPAEAALFTASTREAVIQAIQEQRLPAWSSRDGATVLIPSSALPSVTDSANGPGRSSPDPLSPPASDARQPSLGEAPPGDVLDTIPPPASPSAPPMPEGARGASPGRAARVPEALAPGQIERTTQVVADESLDRVPEAADPPEQAPPTEEADDQLEAPSPRDPGPKSRRGRRGRRVAELIALVLAVGFLARALLVPTGAHPTASPASPRDAHPATGSPASPIAPQPTVAPTHTTTPTPAPPPGPQQLSITKPVFTQRGDRVTASARLNNPNRDLAVRSIPVTFVVRDHHGDVLARHLIHVSVPPNGSARAVVTNLRLRPTGAKVTGVVLRAGRPRWEPGTSFRQRKPRRPALRVEGAGLSSTGPDNLTVVASVSNSGPAPAGGTLVCVVENAAAKKIGSASVDVVAPPQGAVLFRIPMANPPSGVVRADCEITPEGR